MPSRWAESLGGNGFVILHKLIPLVVCLGATVSSHIVIAILFRTAVISLGYISGNHSSIVKICSHPALNANLNGWIDFVIPEICNWLATIRDGRDDRNDRDGRIC